MITQADRRPFITLTDAEKIELFVQGAKAEREAVVKWLRERDGFNDCYSELKDQWLSDRIARGEHLK